MMKASSFFSLSTEKKKKILQSVIRGENEDQRKVMQKYNALKKSESDLAKNRFAVKTVNDHIKNLNTM